jgi:hypothetical protein
MVVMDVLVHQALQMALIEHNHMVEKLSSAGADETLGYTVLPGAPNRNANRRSTKILDSLKNLALESVLAIEDEILRRRIVWEGLTELLRHPGSRRMPCDVPVKDTPPIMPDHEEAILYVEGECRHSKEAHA